MFARFIGHADFLFLHSVRLGSTHVRSLKSSGLRMMLHIPSSNVICAFYFVNRTLLPYKDSRLQVFRMLCFIKMFHNFDNIGNIVSGSFLAKSLSYKDRREIEIAESNGTIVNRKMKTNMK